MAEYRVTLLWVKPNSNPEEHVSVIEADSQTEAKKKANTMLASPPGLGWRSYADTNLWGKVQKKIVEIEQIGAA